MMSRDFDDGISCDCHWYSCVIIYAQPVGFWLLCVCVCLFGNRSWMNVIDVLRMIVVFPIRIVLQLRLDMRMNRLVCMTRESIWPSPKSITAANCIWNNLLHSSLGRLNQRRWPSHQPSVSVNQVYEKKIFSNKPKWSLRSNSRNNWKVSRRQYWINRIHL